ncbi:MAG: biotin/lipoyl-containing protein, partial [Parvularculaceae bacterium]
MGEYVIKLPDVGEGVAEAELVEWMVKEGANVREDEVLAAVMTDKATVEIPSPVEGKIKWLGGKAGDVLAVGSPIIRLEVEGAGNAKAGDAPAKKAEAAKAPLADKAKANGHAAAPMPAAKPAAKVAPAPAAPSVGAPRKEGEKPLAAPAVRKRAADAGVDLRRVGGTGPAGRIGHEDLDVFMRGGGSVT